MHNISRLLTSFFLAVLVWVSAVTATNPNEQYTFARLPLNVIGLSADLLVTSELPETVSVTLYAPHQTMQRYINQPTLLQAYLDLSGLEPGSYVVPVQTTFALRPARLVSVTPLDLELVIDRRVSQAKAIRLLIQGDPERGYQAEQAMVSTARTIVSGPSANVNLVSEVRASLDISGLTQSITRRVSLVPLDANGNRVDGVQLSPDGIEITQPITLLGGYRNVVVKIVTDGQVRSGYRLTNILVSPPNVTVFSGDPQLINDLPGYVETQPLTLTERDNDFEVRLPLNLPEGISVVGEQSVLVRVSIAAIESSLELSLPVEVVGLQPGQQAHISPSNVDVILTGPLAVLDHLLPQELRIFVDVTNLTPGVYQLIPQVDLMPADIRVQSMLPGTLEVEIFIPPTSTATPSPALATVTPTPAP
ncbi:MAG: CdaR family protein [Anaerolineales bacterium]